MEANKKIVMTIAGSDSSGGAGIQADLKTFTALNLHGTTVITCVTSQNTQGVTSIQKISVENIENQIDTVLKDMKPAAVKTGMLYDEKVVKSVAKKIKQYKFKVIVDPVMIATSGDALSKKSLTNSIKKELLPIAYVLTPNTYEASVLTGMKIRDVNDVKKACKELYKTGAKNILIKGGHLTGKQSHDVFYNGKKFSVFYLPRIPNKKAHGSGCTLSALITVYTALGNTPVDAVRKAKYTLWNMIKKGYHPGKGADVLNFDSKLIRETSCYLPTPVHFEIFNELNNSLEKLLSFLKNEYIAEVGMNIGFALPSAKKVQDVCAINGRIIKTKNKPVLCGFLDFGSSKHVASIILTAMNFDSKFRSAMNIKYSDSAIERCKKLGFKIGFFDRIDEPKKAKSTMEWGTSYVLKKQGYVPDVIYDKGSIGKEPMIRVLGDNPDDVIKKVYKLIKTR